MYSMLKRMRQDYNVYVGTETGILKGVNLDHKATISKNFHNLKALDKMQEITCMEWGNPEETELMMGLRNQTLRVFDVNSKIFVSSRELKSGCGPIVSLAKYNDCIVTAVKSGHVTVWNSDGPQVKNTVKNGYLCRMRLDPFARNQMATGGKNHNLTLWNLEAPEEPLFTAKNIKPDELQIPVPVYVTDLVYMNEPNCIATCTRHSHVRLFDPKAQRRPVVNFEFEEAPFTTIAAVPNTSQVVCGTSHGKMLHFDLRMPKPERALGALKSFAGAVRSIVVHPEQPVVFSVSMDRFLRVHNLKTHKVMFKEYLKSRLTQVVIRKDMQKNDLFPDEIEKWKSECLEEEETESDSDQEDSKTKRKLYFQKKQRMKTLSKKQKK